MCGLISEFPVEIKLVQTLDNEKRQINIDTHIDILRAVSENLMNT